MSTKPAEQMDRDELEETVRALRSRMNELEEKVETYNENTVTRTVLNLLIQELSGTDVQDLTADPAAHRDHLAHVADRIDSLEQTMQRHENQIDEAKSKATRSGAHWQECIQLAQSLADDPEHKVSEGTVILYKDDIQRATKLSSRRAGQLIDEWTDGPDENKQKLGVVKQEYKPPSSSRNGSAQKKGIKIDLEVWGDE